jgi:ubiquinone biosynthesis monooxygenase Coq7
MYRELPSSHPIQWVDISYIAEHAQWGADPAELMRRFHVLTPKGEMLSGARAFVHLWSLLPVWKYVAHTSKVPGVLWLMEGLYLLFLKVRPWLQYVARKKATSTNPVSHSEPL